VNRDKATDCVQQWPASFTDQMNNDIFFAMNFGIQSCQAIIYQFTVL